MVQWMSFMNQERKILDESGKLREKYIGQEGYALFAKNHYGGSMQKAFMNVSSVLSESEFKELGWQGFNGSEIEFHELRRKILDESGKLREQFTRSRGLPSFC